MYQERPAQRSPKLPSRRWLIKKRSSHVSLSSGSWNIFGRLALDLKRDFVETNMPQDIEHTDDVAVDRVRIATNEYFGFRILLMNFLQRGGELIITHLRLVEIWIPIPIDRNADVITLGLCLARLADRQGHLDAFHLHLAQAHHHETGEEKEHDVDQRNDLNPRFLVWNWRAYVHWIPLD